MGNGEVLLTMETVCRQWTCCAWRALLLCAFAITVVICVAAAVVLLLTQKPVVLGDSSEFAAWDTTNGNSTIRRKPAHYRPFTFEDLLANKHQVRTYYPTKWLTDDSLMIPDAGNMSVSEEDANINIIRPQTSQEETFIPGSEFQAGFTSDRATFSPSGKFVALSKIVNHVFRYSEDAIYQIAKVNDGKLLKYTFVGPNGTGTEALSSFKWNPNPLMHDFIFVYNYNLYYQADPEKPGTAIPLSENGHNFLRYGIADWLYEEEITPNALFWSKRGDLTAYIKFDDQYVHRAYVPKYYSFRQYPDYMEVPYPKAGVSNQPEVTLYLMDRKKNKKVVVSPPEELMTRNMSYYIFANSFISVAMNGTRREKLLTTWADREQMNVYMTLCDLEDCVLTYSQNYEINDKELWAEPEDFQNLHASPSGFFVILPHQYTDGNIYQHIAHIRVQDDGSGRVTTFHGGTYDIVKIHGYDYEKDTLFYESAGGAIAFKRLFRIRGASTRLAQIQCISCLLPNCDSATISISPKGKRAALTCNKAFDNGRLFLIDTEKNNEFVQLRGFEAAVLSFDEPTITYEKVMLPSGIEAHVGIMRPPKFDETANHPVLLDVYGGPNSYINSLETPWDFLVYLCSTRQMIVIYIDGRGSKHRGWDIKGAMKNTIGGPEVDDQIEGMRKIIDKYPYMNKKSVAVFGWSYGGFLATHIAVKDRGNVFRCALAVAPVADFTFYDSAYTERYLGMPSENMAGYNNSRLTDKVARLRNVNYFLAHGSADDNVHYQNSALLAGALQEAGIAFTQLVGLFNTI
ncbi:unnamed protein product, partial [Mesorhabditis spiculigera]